MTTSEYQKLLPQPLHWEASRQFWEGAKRHELMIPRCRLCNRLFFYPMEHCPNCLRDEVDWVRVSGNGWLYSFTEVYQPAHPGFQADAPYLYVIVQLDEGPRMLANLIDCPVDQAAIDMRVSVVFDDVTPEWTLVKFKPA